MIDFRLFKLNSGLLSSKMAELIHQTENKLNFGKQTWRKQAEIGVWFDEFSHFTSV